MKKLKLKSLLNEDSVLLTEQKIADITKAYADKEEQRRKAKDILEKAQDEYNRIHFESGKEGDLAANDFMTQLGTLLIRELNMNPSRREPNLPHRGGSGLIELYVGDDKDGVGKVSIHNRKYLGQHTNPVSYMIRDEHNIRNAERGELPESFDAKKAAKFLVQQVKKFDKKYGGYINWLK